MPHALTAKLALYASIILALVSCPLRSSAAQLPSSFDIKLERLGTYATGIFNEGAAEIVAHDPRTQRLFIVNGSEVGVSTGRIDVVSIIDPSQPTLLFSIDMTPYGRAANSVAVSSGGVIAAAVEAAVKTDPGSVVFFDADGSFLSSVTVGALPDMLTFTPNGRRVLVANEGEPSDDYTMDPEGTVSIIDLPRGGPRMLTQANVRTAAFTGFNAPAALDASIRIFGPNASVAQNLEPEYITIDEQGHTAWVTLQENNALGILDIRRGEFTELKGLGFKNHNLPENALDPSDRDGPNNTGRININPYPVFGIYQPDAIASYRVRGRTYLITANEGDARDYAAFSEERRVSTLTLDPIIFPDAATLRTNAQLGRLNVTRVNGDTDGDGDYDALYAFGARSFSILTDRGVRVFDSGDQLERITAAQFPAFFNSENDANTFDTRSDNKGPEPEGVTIGEILGRNFAFIGLERIGGVMVYDVTNPFAPRFVEYVNNRDFAGDPEAGTAGDLGPEGLLFIPRFASPTLRPLLVTANEISGTTTVYEVRLTTRE